MNKIQSEKKTLDRRDTERRREEEQLYGRTPWVWWTLPI